MRLIYSLLALAFFICSCESGWNEEDKEMYYQSCYQDAVTWANSEADAKTYCECMQEKLMAKYPDITQLVEHMHEIGSDPELQECKQQIRK